MTTQKINDYKLLIPTIKTRLKSLGNKRKEKIRRVNLVIDPAFTLISFSDVIGNPNIKKENVLKIKEFLQNIALKQVQTDLEGNKYDYKAMFISFSNSIGEHLKLIEATMTKLNAKTTGYATKFFNDFGNGVFNDDAKSLGDFEQLVTTFALKNTTLANDGLFQKIKQYMEKEKNIIIEKLKEINANMSKEPIQLSSNKFANSLVLKPEEHEMVDGWIKSQLGVFKTYEPIFNSLDHGFTCQAFHQKCDGKGATIIFIETTAGKRFGGYANSPWDTNNSWIVDEKCFIFSLDLKEKYLHKPGNTYSMIGHSSFYNFIFGGHDIKVNKNCNSNNSCNCAPNNTYDCGSRSANDIAGSNLFTVKNYEVYLVK